jgi:hypothetical protein
MRFFQFKRALRRLKRKHPDQGNVIDQALANDEICEEACAWAEEHFEGHSADAVGGPFMDFLSWILANGPELIAFITKLIELFTASKAHAKKGR